MKAIDITGKRFGRLMVLSKAAPTKPGRSAWNCICDCDNKCVVVGVSLLSGNTRSCGCFKLDSVRARNFVHGMHGSPEYCAWVHMMARCRRPTDKAFKHYGGRGISVCKRWLEFKNFYADMGNRPDGLTLERINNDGNYEPANCKWATWREQGRNTRYNRHVVLDGVKMLLIDAAHCLQVSTATASRMANDGRLMVV